MVKFLVTPFIFFALALSVPFLFVAVPAAAKQILTNETSSDNAPDWLTATRIEKVTAHILGKLDWTIRRVNVKWYYNETEFEQVHGMGPFAIAVTKVRDGVAVINLGPKVTNDNFDRVFGHELVHVIVAQKYKSSIPSWLEEGLANHYASSEKVDYKWLAKQTIPADVRQLSHPMRGSKNDVEVRYRSSQALAEMLSKKCDLENLIRISFERKMEDYIKTYCDISDLNDTFRTWIKKQAT